MSAKKVVSKKAKKMVLVIYDHDFNSYDFLVEVIRHVLGYDQSQACNCANIIINKGEYAVKTYLVKESDKAHNALSILTEQEVPAKLLLI